jgi:APA family basic amino acid/polyamine antiporter
VTDQPQSSTDRIARGVVSTFGAGLFLGLTPAAGLAGWWLVPGMALAAALAVLFTLSTQDSPSSAAASLVGILGRIAAAMAAATAFGRYVLPGRPEAGAVMLVIVVAGLVLLAPPLPGVVDRVAAIVVVGVLVLVVVSCFAIAPVDLAVAPPADAAGADNAVGLFPAALLLYLGFIGSPSVVRRERLAIVGVVLVVSLAVAIGALWQLGGERLALSTAPLRDALAAADAAGIDGLLAVGATVACVFALRGVLGDIRELAPAQPNHVVAFAAVVAALGALLFTPEYTIAGASVLLLGEAGIRVLSGRRGKA